VPTPRGAYHHRMVKRRRTRSRIRLAADLLLVVGGLVLAFPFWSSAYTHYQQGRLNDAYAARAVAFDATVRAVSSAPAAQRDPALRMRRLAGELRRQTKPGDPIGRLLVPRIGVDEVVTQGATGAGSLSPHSDVGYLRGGPVHYGNTPLPGQGEPFAVAGHRTTYGAPFYRLAELRRGDRIIVKTPYGRFTYRVAKLTRVKPSDVSVLADRGYGLVLTTCDPPYSARQRLIVWAKMDGFSFR
jgi:sortase A